MVRYTKSAGVAVGTMVVGNIGEVGSTDGNGSSSSPDDRLDSLEVEEAASVGDSEELE